MEKASNTPSVATNTVFTEAGQLMQRFLSDASLDFVVVDARQWTPPEFNIYLAGETHRPFDLSQDTLHRVRLCQQSDNTYILLLVIHNIVADFWSLAVLAHELGLLYSDLNAVLPPLKTSYASAIEDQNALLTGEGGERLWTYWQQQLGDRLPILNLPTDFPRPSVQTFKGASKSVQLGRTLTDKLHSLSRDQNVTLYMTLLAAFKLLLARYSGQQDVLIGSPTNGRSRPELTNQIGYFVNPVVMRSTLQVEQVRSQGFNLSPINSDTVGQIQLDGVSNSAVALIISSGSPLAGQSRPLPTAASPPVPAQYLDLGNVSGPAYVGIGTPNSFNDKVLPLTREQLFRAVETRVIGEVKAALEEYYSTNGYYPKPALFTDATCLGTGNNSSTCLNNAASCNTLVCRWRIPANADTGSTAVGWPPLSILRGTTGISPDWFQKDGWRELIY